MASPKEPLDDLTRDRHNLGPTCTICPSNLTSHQHRLLHYSLVTLRLAINNKLKYDPCKSKATSKAYFFKLKEIQLAHELGFCKSDKECHQILIRINKLINGIESYINISKLRKKVSKLRI
jgi:hypothetical protein